MIEFSYKEERLSESKTVFRPVADVIIIAGDNTEVEIPMYIDSGADLSLIPLRFGKALGFTKEGKSIEEMRGIASTLPYIRQNVKFKFNNEIIDAEIAWALIEEVPALLGRKDIFDAFKITFLQQQKKIIFE